MAKKEVVKTTKGIFHIAGSTCPGLYNKRIHDAPKDAVYIGRPSKWGNPFVIGEHGTRFEVIQKYEEYLLNSPELMSCIVKELRGKDLVCFCAPHPCHGHVLMKHANCVLRENEWVMWEEVRYPNLVLPEPFPQDRRLLSHLTKLGTKQVT